MKKLLLLSIVTLVATSPALADAERVAAPGLLSSTRCGMTETASININFNGMESDATAVKAKFDTKVAEIQNLIKDAKLDKFEMQSMNYSISPQNYGGMTSSYQFNGNLSFNVLPAAKATELMAELTKKGYQASVSVSAYRNGSVPCAQNESDKKE